MILKDFFFFFQAEDGIRDRNVTGVQTCALPISAHCHRFYELSRGDPGKGSSLPGGKRRDSMKYRGDSCNCSSKLYKEVWSDEESQMLWESSLPGSGHSRRAWRARRDDPGGT